MENGHVEEVFIWKRKVPSMKFCMFFTFGAVVVPVGIPRPNQFPGLAVNESTLLPSKADVAEAVRLLQTSIAGAAPNDPFTAVVSVKTPNLPVCLGRSFAENTVVFAFEYT